jgi:hypothetical protein
MRVSGGRSGGFRIRSKKTYGFPNPCRVLVPALTQEKNTPKGCFFLVDDQGLEAIREIAESLINKGIAGILPQGCPKEIIKINQPNFV